MSIKSNKGKAFVFAPRILASLAGAALVGTLGLAGCGGNTQQAQPTQQTATEATGEDAQAEQQGIWVMTKETTEYEGTYLDENGETQSYEMSEESASEIDEHGNQVLTTFTQKSDDQISKIVSKATFDDEGLSQSSSSALVVGDESDTDESDTVIECTDTWEHDTQGRVTKNTSTSSDSKQVVTYEYDEQGNIVVRTNTIEASVQDENGATYLGREVNRTTYDVRGYPLENVYTSTNVDDDTVLIDTTLAFTYEDNKDGKPIGLSATCTDNETGEVVNTARGTFTYDADGNCVGYEDKTEYQNGTYLTEKHTYEYVYVDEPSAWMSVIERLWYRF